MIGILLFNLGGPERLEDVRPFLYNLFSDPEIINLPSILRKPLAAFIAVTRGPKSRGYYSKIGGGSPLRRVTVEQGRALEARLAERGLEARSYVGMRAWYPFIGEAVDQLVADGVSEVVVLPLYPQFSVSTTGSSTKELYRILWGRGGLRSIRRRYITRWYDHPGYIDAIARRVTSQLSEFPDPSSVHLLFTAHSIPLSYIEKGDPYEQQTEATVRLVLERLGLDLDHTLAYQSKVGPVKWLAPSTESQIQQLGARGVEQVLAIPISFVSDHIETLYEIDILYRDLATNAGIRHFRRTEALGVDPGFIDCLADMVVARLSPRVRGGAR
ncbi:MAG TPA: ferrochelatase [Blastocatellia bacterium]|nr:ferrochelatase [Blastocatellia bacterium]